jgi:hypothetical protein
MKGRRWITLAVVGASALGVPFGQAAKADSNQVDPRLAFFREYVREVIELHRLREQAVRELAESPSADQQLATMVRVGTRYKMQTSVNIAMLEDIKLGEPCKAFADGLRDVNELRRSKHVELVGAAQALMIGPKPGVDYAKISARVPEISAELEQVDRTTFTIAPAAFICLVNTTKVNARGKVDRLIIDGNERRSLAKQLQSGFGATLQAKDDADTFVSAAKVLQYGLESQQWKNSDDK